MNKKASLTVIFITIFIDLMGFGILIPILPTFASKSLGISDFGIGIIIASYSFIQFIFSHTLGRLSDKIGRRRIILFSLLFTITSYIVFSFSSSFILLLFSRVLGGIGGSNIGAAQAYIADITPKEERAKGMGVIGAAFGLGFVFGPLIGGFLSGYGYQITGFASAFMSSVAFLYAFFMLPEPKHILEANRLENHSLIDIKFAKQILKHNIVGLLIVIFFIIVFSMANIYGTFSLLGYKVYNFTDRQIGELFGILGIVSAIVQGGLMRILSSKFSERSVVLIGAVFMSLSLALLPYGVNFIGVAAIACVLGLGVGILQPTVLSMISKYSSEKQQGAVLGLNSSFSAFGRVLGPLWGGFSFNFFGYQFPFITGAAFTFVTFLIALFLLSSHKLSQALEHV
ncbi:MFS transporter [Melioribacteraceae bacterium 4301-Me]|uniref:MFS transporter n=1 Tax=Pyranulibacter aquaticus TaxID=3163344 RepID=UPI00359B57AE